MADGSRARRSRRYPTGRTLHLIDLDNLLGPRGPGPVSSSGWPRPAAVRAVLGAYRAAAHVRADDHEVILGTSRTAVEAKLASHSSRVVLRRGSLQQSVPPDLAPDCCAAHYDRVVLGSGDASLASMLHALAERGVAVRVVARAGSLSRTLGRTGSVVVALREHRTGHGGGT